MRIEYWIHQTAVCTVYDKWAFVCFFFWLSSKNNSNAINVNVFRTGKRRSSNGIKFLLFKYVNWNLCFDIFIFSHQKKNNNRTFALSMHFGRSFNLNHPSDWNTMETCNIFNVKWRVERASEKKNSRTKRDEKNEWKQWYYLLHVGVIFKIWMDNVCFYSVSGPQFFFFIINVVVFPVFCFCFACDFHLNNSISVSHTIREHIKNGAPNVLGSIQFMRHGLVWFGLAWPVFKYYVMLFPLFIISIQLITTQSKIFSSFLGTFGWMVFRMSCGLFGFRKMYRISNGKL